MIKKKSKNKKMGQRLDIFVKKLEDDGHNQQHTDLIISLSRVLQCNAINDRNNDSDDDSETITDS